MNAKMKRTCGWFFVLGVVMVSGCGGPINESNYDKIKDGMTLAEVEGILGKGTEQASVSTPGVSVDVPVVGVKVEATSNKIYKWESGGKTIIVTFMNDKMAGKSKNGF